MRVVHRLSFVIAPGHTNATARFVSDRSFELSAILAEAWENGEVPEEHVPAPFSLEIFPAADHAAAIRIVDPSRSVGHTGRVQVNQWIRPNWPVMFAVQLVGSARSRPVNVSVLLESRAA